MTKCSECEKMREALENIALTAQMASQYEPEQFCRWAHNAALEALQSCGKENEE